MLVGYWRRRKERTKDSHGKKGPETKELKKKGGADVYEPPKKGIKNGESGEKEKRYSM